MSDLIHHYEENETIEFKKQWNNYRGHYYKRVGSTTREILPEELGHFNGSDTYGEIQGRHYNCR